MLLALRGIWRLKEKWEIFTTPIGEAGQIRSANKKFQGFFLFAAFRLLAEYESQDKKHWRSISETKELVKRGQLQYLQRFAYCYRNRLFI
jgi:hypothetical protein